MGLIVENLLALEVNVNSFAFKQLNSTHLEINVKVKLRI